MSLVNTDAQVHKHHHTLIGMAIIKIKHGRQQVLVVRWRNWNPCALLVRVQNGTVWEVPQKLNRIIIIQQLHF